MKNEPWLQQDKEKKINTIMTYLFKIKYSPQVSLSVSEYYFAEKFEIPSTADNINRCNYLKSHLNVQATYAF